MSLMFGVQITESHTYLLVGVFKRGVIYSASYSNALDDENREYITCHSTGDTFYSIRSFTQSILGLGADNGDDEWIQCLYYDEDAKMWFPLFYLLPQKDSYIEAIINPK